MQAGLGINLSAEDLRIEGICAAHHIADIIAGCISEDTVVGTWGRSAGGKRTGFQWNRIAIAIHALEFMESELETGSHLGPAIFAWLGIHLGIDECTCR